MIRHGTATVAARVDGRAPRKERMRLRRTAVVCKRFEHRIGNGDVTWAGQPATRIALKVVTKGDDVCTVALIAVVIHAVQRYDGV